MFRSAVWEALVDAERRAGPRAVTIEELVPTSDDRWEARAAEQRGALLSRASAAAAGRLAPLLAPSSSSSALAPPLVALALPRSADYVAAALAVLAAGAAFLPMEQADAVATDAAVAVAHAAGAAVLVVAAAEEEHDEGGAPPPQTSRSCPTTASCRRAARRPRPRWSG